MEMYDGQRMIEAGFGLDQEEEQRLDLSPIDAGMMSAEEQAQQAAEQAAQQKAVQAQLLANQKAMEQAADIVLASMAGGMPRAASPPQHHSAAVPHPLAGTAQDSGKAAPTAEQQDRMAAASTSKEPTVAPGAPSLQVPASVAPPIMAPRRTLQPRTAALQSPAGQMIGLAAGEETMDKTPLVDCTPEGQEPTPSPAPPPPPRPLPAGSPQAAVLQHVAEGTLQELERKKKVAQDGMEKEMEAQDKDGSVQWAERRALYAAQQHEAAQTEEGAVVEAGLGDDAGLQQSSATSSQEGSVGAGWSHREHYEQQGGRPHFQASANQGGSRAKKYTFHAVQDRAWVAQEEEQSLEY